MNAEGARRWRCHAARAAYPALNATTSHPRKGNRPPVRTITRWLSVVHPPPSPPRVENVQVREEGQGRGRSSAPVRMPAPLYPERKRRMSGSVREFQGRAGARRYGVGGRTHVAPTETSGRNGACGRAGSGRKRRRAGNGEGRSGLRVTARRVMPSVLSSRHAASALLSRPGTTSKEAAAKQQQSSGRRLAVSPMRTARCSMSFARRKPRRKRRLKR